MPLRSAHFNLLGDAADTRRQVTTVQAHYPNRYYHFTSTAVSAAHSWFGSLEVYLQNVM